MTEKASTNRAKKVIRGHHLEAVAALLNKELTPQGMVDVEFSMAMGDPVEVPEAVKEQIRAGTFVEGVSGAYRYDLLGDGTPEQVAAYKQSRLALFTDYDAMGDDTPVKVVDGQIDDLCKGCMFGSHCLQDQRDTSFVQAFTNVAKDREVDGQLTISTDHVRLADSNVPTERIVVETNAGVLRTVLRGTAFIEEFQRLDWQERLAMIKQRDPAVIENTSDASIHESNNIGSNDVGNTPAEETDIFQGYGSVSSTHTTRITEHRTVFDAEPEVGGSSHESIAKSEAGYGPAQTVFNRSKTK